MPNSQDTNMVLLTGILADQPVFSHAIRDQRFFLMHLTVPRLSGQEDVLPLLAAENLVTPELIPGIWLEVTATLRSFNKKDEQRNRLILTLLPSAIKRLGEKAQPSNLISLTGSLCKKPTYRETPLGREICDMMLAVGRRYGKSDYLPCIVWGHKARMAAGFEVGDRVSCQGRMQSRQYTKTINGEDIIKTAYEVSIAGIELVNTVENVDTDSD